ncbi:sensor histidine kinase [Flindersiella endophytica]
MRANLTWRDGGHPLVVIVIGFAIYLAGGYTLWSTGTPLWAHLIGFTVAGCALVALRRKHPLIALGVGVAVAGVDIFLGLTIPVILILGDFVYNAVLYTSRRTSYILSGVVCGGAIVQGGVLAAFAPNWRQGLLTFLSTAAILSIPVGWATSVRWYREAVKAERARTEQLAQLAERDRAAAVSGERSRLAADLHDVIAGHLSAIAIQSEAALSMAGKDPATVSTVLRSVRENSLSALREMREMIDLLQADGTRTAPARLHDLDRLLESAGASGLEVSAEVALSGRLPVTVDLAAYRIVQEALTNAAKHAPGADISVSLSQDREGLVVDVRNTLTRPAGGGDVEEGTGLRSMRTRAEAVDGSLSARPTPEGWQVRAVLPVEEREGETL